MRCLTPQTPRNNINFHLDFTAIPLPSNYTPWSASYGDNILAKRRAQYRCYIVLHHMLTTRRGYSPHPHAHNHKLAGRRCPFHLESSSM